ncbi:MAG: hypothetical protein K2G09_05110 [Paramuribaculum sp.]|nr:hypothetical protein [Paramuribaculum sp.]
MIDNRFRISRTFDLFRLYIIENRKFLLICAAAIVGILICVAISIASDVSYKRAYSMYRPDLDPAIPYLVPTYIIIGYIFAALGASFMFSELKSKQGRIRTLMVPANSSEKLISRMLVYVVLYTVFYVLAICIAEFFRDIYLMAKMTVAPVTPLYTIFGNEAAINFLTTDKYPILLPCILFVGVFAIQSFFVLGSTLWYKYSSVKTFALFFALFFFYTISVFMLGSSLSEGKTYNNLDHFMSNYFGYVFLCFEIIVCLFNWCMAWWRLRETDVITTKR